LREEFACGAVDRPLVLTRGEGKQVGD
jgi:hypothetical protein